MKRFLPCILLTALISISQARPIEKVDFEDGGESLSRKNWEGWWVDSNAAGNKGGHF